MKKDRQKAHQLKGRDLWDNKMNLACTGRHLRRCDNKLEGKIRALSSTDLYKTNYARRKKLQGKHLKVKFNSTDQYILHAKIFPHKKELM